MDTDLKLGSPSSESDSDEIFEIVFTLKASWSCQHCRFSTSSGVKASNHLFDKHVNGGGKGRKGGKKVGEEEQVASTSDRRPYKKRTPRTRWNCIECEESFSTRNLLVKHLKKDHPDVEENDDNDELFFRDSEIKFRCSVCNKGFQKRKFHQLHEPFCTVELQCQHCDKTFHKKAQPYNKFRYNFRLHESACSLKPAKVLHCRYCEKEFSTPHNCKQHMEMNCPARKDKPNMCMYCREVFDTKRKLDRHFGACERRQRKLKLRRRRTPTKKTGSEMEEDDDEEQEEENYEEEAAGEEEEDDPMEAFPEDSDGQYVEEGTADPSTKTKARPQPGENTDFETQQQPQFDAEDPFLIKEEEERKGAAAVESSQAVAVDKAFFASSF